MSYSATAGPVLQADNVPLKPALAFGCRVVDNPVLVKTARPNPIPLPAAVLALSVAVCIGAAGPANGSPIAVERPVSAEQRQTLEHLLDAIQRAAKKLTDQLTGQATLADRAAVRPVLALVPNDPPTAGAFYVVDLHLREALLNLPPPTC